MIKLLIEAIVVGILLAVIGFVISLIIMYITSKDFSLKKYKFWKSVVLSYFLTGFIGHYIFEYTKLNKYYCIHGNACQI